jgi:hypothetical protein
MGTVLLDPTSRVDQSPKAFATRLDTLSGTTVGLLDINKAKGVFFLDRLEEILREQYGVTEVLRRTKLTPGRPAAEDIQQELQEKCDAVIEALSD